MSATPRNPKIVEPIPAAVAYVTAPKPRKDGGQYRSICFSTAQGEIWKSFSLLDCEAIANSGVVQLIPYWTLEGRRKPHYVEHHQVLLQS